MSLSPGSRLGPFEILAPIGAGGMGEVFRARDTRLNRDVAIKVLPALLTQDPERVARFRREAQLLAALNHPNIALIHGLEEADGRVALVLELVDGEDLAQRLKREPIPVAEAIGIARQIAEGLESAHEKGIVHRDLKPANIKITSDGTVKILDFGLAKAYEADTSSTDSMNSPTMTHAMTEAGLILGTAAYMSPEQARARAVDKRADIWSFGVVVCEMLMGKHLFEGETVSDTLASVLRQDITLSALPTDTPSRVKRLLGRCLERDPKKRLRDIGEARLVLEDTTPELAAVATTPVATKKASPVPIVIVTAIAAAAVGAFGWGVLHPAAKPQKTSLSIALPPGQVLSGNGGPAITRDGRLIAYAARDSSGVARLYLRSLDRFEAAAVPESDGAQAPFFSPDGSRVGFFAHGKMLTAAVSGGAPTPIADASNQAMGGTWGEDGTVVFAPSLSAGLLRVPASGGTAQQLTQPDGGAMGYAHSRPSFLPGGKTLLFTQWGGSKVDERGSVVLDLKSAAWTRITTGFGTVRYAPNGRLLMSGPQGVRSAAFDPAHPQRLNPETFVLDDVYYPIAWSDSWFTVSESGTLVYVPGDPILGTLTWVDLDGRTMPTLDKPISLSDAVLSPDGQRIAFQDKDDVLWTMDVRRGTRLRLNRDDELTNGYPVWSRDGSHIFFTSNRSGDWELYSVPSGGGPAKKVLTREGNQFPQSIAPDGTLMFAERSKGRIGTDLLTLAPDGTVTPFLDAQPAGKACGQFSPDGRLVAYVSDESGREEVYVRPFHGGEAVPVSTEGGNGPRWAPDGKAVYFRSGDAFFAVPVTTSGSAVTVGDAKKLFAMKAAPGRSILLPGYSVSSDGKRLLVHLLDASAIPTRINVVEGWSAKP
ncbi:MAG TPA: protein kinase [Candidatus Polarisedimenticolaceae bacterium]|nr:protein kinase [Candidatus Polarisedimenticolaceae bacterium]